MKKWQSNDMMKQTVRKIAGKQRKKWGRGVCVFNWYPFCYFRRERCPSAHSSSPGSPRHCYVFVSVLCGHSEWDKAAYKTNKAPHPCYFILFPLLFVFNCPLPLPPSHNPFILANSLNAKICQSSLYLPPNIVILSLAIRCSSN